MLEDHLRLCFAGDSFVAGVGDPHRLGWAGRLAAAASPDIPLTVYNLGIRGQTAPRIEDRLIAECAPRLPEEAWMREVREGDGAHPGAAGYAAMAALVASAWNTWFGGLTR